LNQSHWTYADSGVNVKDIRFSHINTAEILKETFINRKGKLGNVIGEIGHYAGLIDLGKEYAIALHTDGVGTKVLIAQIMNKFDTIGIDCIAMNANDIICLGAEPLSFLDYIGLKKFDNAIINDIITGLITGAKEASVAIVGGETAVMPDVITGKGEKAFDLVGMILGIVNKKKIITGNSIKEDDIIIGIESSGIHSNGLSLARKVLLSKYNVNDVLLGLNNTLGEELLKPTKIYVKPIMDIIKDEIKVNGLAHITGGGFMKLSRLVNSKNLCFKLNNMPKKSDIFKVIQKEGNISKYEMYRTFNMGIGFCIVTQRSMLEKIKNIFWKYKINSDVIGNITKGSGIYINKLRIY
jgi:phosphoribosylformylglycinamidine cyclo-ligase